MFCGDKSIGGPPPLQNIRHGNPEVPAAKNIPVKINKSLDESHQTNSLKIVHVGRNIGSPKGNI